MLRFRIQRGTSEDISFKFHFTFPRVIESSKIHLTGWKPPRRGNEFVVPLLHLCSFLTLTPTHPHLFGSTARSILNQPFHHSFILIILDYPSTAYFNMPPKSAPAAGAMPDPQLQFLFSALKHSESLKINWDEVAKENGIGYARNA